MLIFFLILLFLIASNPISKNARIIIYDENNEEIVYLNHFNKTNTEDLTTLQPKHIQYILQIEDKDFYQHHGFSIPRIIKSIFHNLTHIHKQGGSTITQQYIKNTYLTNKKSLFRKIKEIYLSIRLESTTSKDTILEEYLSALYFGNNIYGLTNASKYYFNKEIPNLTNQEMIALIALWNAPTIYSNHIEKWEEKKNTLAEYLLNQGVLDKNEYQKVIQPLSFKINKDYLSSNKQYFIDQVIHEYKKKNLSASFNEVVRIYTHYNKKTEAIQSYLDTNYALLSIDSKGYFTCCVGNKNYTESPFNIAMNGNRDIGSTIKPLLYYEAIRCGLEKTIFDSKPYSFTYQNQTITISNNSNTYYNTIGMKEALAVSDNIYAVKMHLKLGMNTLVNHLKKYNISAKPYPSLALGSVGMSLNELVGIYNQFFSDGFIQPLYIHHLQKGKKTYTFTPKTKTILDKTICLKIKELLNAPFDTSIPHATCNSLTSKLPTICYGKSGLTDYDSYMIGFNSDHLVAVWSGNTENEKLMNIEYKRLPKELFCQTILALETK